MKAQIQKLLRTKPYLQSSEIALILGCSPHKVGAMRRKMKNGTFSNVTGNGKKVARALIVDSIDNSEIIKGKILSLPAKGCKLERLIKQSIPKNKFKTIGCEANTNIYFDMLNTISKERLNIEPYNGAIQDKIYEAKEDEYSHLLLDYCGTLNTLCSEIAYSLLNKIVVSGGIVAITLSLDGRANYTSGFVGDIIDSVPKHFIDGSKMTLSGARIFFTRFLNDYTIELEHTYRDSSNMVLYVLKRR